MEPGTIVGGEMDDDVVARIELAPDAGLVKSLGANHSLESAIADLIDNSIDAGANKVGVRLLTHDGRLARVEVVDDGWGMDDALADAAMTLGHQREYRDLDLGNFGMGLKAASFAHADVLTVWSSSESAPPVGRRIRRSDFSKNFACEVLSQTSAGDQSESRARTLGTRRGTTVVWTELRHTYKGRNADEARTWMADVQSALHSHLGLVFHRLISAEKILIEIQVDDRDQFELGIAIPVAPIDPFGYASTGHPNYPKTLVASIGEIRIPLTCHVWPSRSDRTGYRIGLRSGDQFQGFFIYRNDRLLQAGGWSDLANRSPRRQLARVVIDDISAIGPFVTMNPEKQGVKFKPAFHEALAHAAASDGTGFDDYLQDAEASFVASNKRKHLRKPAIAPDKGFAPELRRIISSELPLISGEAMRLQWRQMGTEEFIDIDFPSRTLWLNSRYRSLFSPERGSLNDAPVLKALLYLLTHQIFEGQHLGVRDKDEIELWKSVLGAAAAAESRMRSDGAL